MMDNSEYHKMKGDLPVVIPKLKEDKNKNYDKARRLQLEQNRWTEKWYREHPDDTPETI